jgi:phospholipase/carboxylesterase
VIHVVREPDGEGRGTVVLLHGRGADEHDLLPLLGVLDPKRRYRGITVGAPLSQNPPHPPGKHWYALRQVGWPDPPTFASTYAELERFLDEELALDWSRTVIGGFSQGGVMSYALGLGPGRPVPAGILGMSCFIPRFEDASWEPDFATRPQLPVAHVHGEQDPVIPISFARDVRERIEAAGLPLFYREFPGGHHVDPRVLVELSDWLAQRLA